MDSNSINVKGKVEFSGDTMPSYKSYFHIDSTLISSLHDVYEGGFVDIDPDRFPEGLAGDIASDFEFFKNYAWMIRDTSKLVFKLIELHEESFLKSTLKKKTVKSVKQPPLSLPGYTDRPEWTAASVKFNYYGVNIPTPSRLDENGLITLKGPGSLADELTNRLIEKSSNLPNKALLSGKINCKTALSAEHLRRAAGSGKICHFESSCALCSSKRLDLLVYTQWLGTGARRLLHSAVHIS